MTECRNRLLRKEITSFASGVANTCELSVPAIDPKPRFSNPLPFLFRSFLCPWPLQQSPGQPPWMIGL